MRCSVLNEVAYQVRSASEHQPSPAPSPSPSPPCNRRSIDGVVAQLNVFDTDCTRGLGDALQAARQQLEEAEDASRKRLLRRCADGGCIPPPHFTVYCADETVDFRKTLESLQPECIPNAEGREEDEVDAEALFDEGVEAPTSILEPGRGYDDDEAGLLHKLRTLKDEKKAREYLGRSKAEFLKRHEITRDDIEAVCSPTRAGIFLNL